MHVRMAVYPLRLSQSRQPMAAAAEAEQLGNSHVATGHGHGLLLHRFTVKKGKEQEVAQEMSS